MISGLCMKSVTITYCYKKKCETFLNPKNVENVRKRQPAKNVYQLDKTLVCRESVFYYSFVQMIDDD